MCGIFGGPNLRRFYCGSLVLYLFGASWGYATVSIATTATRHPMHLCLKGRGGCCAWTLVRCYP
jgi:hypothetical protein